MIVPRHRPRRSRRRVPATLRRAVAALAVVAGVVTLAGGAGAHSSLVDSLPVGGETVASLDEILLVFGDAVVDDEQLRVRLETPAGDILATDPAELVDPFTVRAAVPEPPAPGTYYVRYRVTSYDGDLGEGGFLFDYDPTAGAGGGATWVLLGIGVAAIVGVLFLLRPTGSGSAPSGSTTPTR
jgi:copper resistance protein C